MPNHINQINNWVTYASEALSALSMQLAEKDIDLSNDYEEFKKAKACLGVVEMLLGNRK